MQEHEAFFGVESFMDEFYKSGKSFLEFYRASGAYKKMGESKPSKNQKAPQNKKSISRLEKTQKKISPTAPLKQMALFNGLDSLDDSFLKKTAIIESNTVIDQIPDYISSQFEGAVPRQLSIFDAIAY